MKTKLARANSAAVEEAAARLIRPLRTGNWLPSDSAFRSDLPNALRKFEDGCSTVDGLQVNEYLATSTLLHCFDGWSFLGRALDAQMAGDPGSAIHLGYYAELRAAMSVLASQGIGVLDRVHAVATGHDSCERVTGKGSTHRFAWRALECWTDDEAANVLFRVVSPLGIPLRTWLTRFHSSDSGFSSFATDLVRQWGLELHRWEADRKSRNLVSYNPTGLVSSPLGDIVKTLRSVITLWRCCEPDQSGAFGRLDRSLLRHSIEQTFQSAAGSPPSEKEPGYIERITEAVRSMDLAPDTEKLVLRSLLPPRVVFPLLSDAAVSGSLGSSAHTTQVLARAALLLRLATGCSRTLFGSTGENLHELLFFWWSSSAVRRRLWSGDRQPESPVELWDDVEAAIEETEDWLAAASPEQTYYDFWRHHGNQAAVLTSTERICLWGLGL